MRPDYDDIVNLIRRGDLESVRRIVEDGWDVDEPDRWTGSTGLLWACGSDHLALAELLLDHGADPDVIHTDGYNCYDSTGSAAIRRLLLDRGFSLRLGYTRGASRGMQDLRHMLPVEPATEEHTLTVPGTDLFLEVRVLDLPPVTGSVLVRCGEWSMTYTGPAYTIRAVTGPVASATVTFTGFRGECRARLFCEDTIATNDGPRSFWLPDWAP